MTMPLLLARGGPRTTPSSPATSPFSRPFPFDESDCDFGSCSARSRCSRPCTRKSLHAKFKNAFETSPSVDSVRADGSVGAILEETRVMAVATSAFPMTLRQVELQQTTALSR